MNISSCGIIVDDKKREMISHGTTAFPLGYYEDDSSKSVVPWHWHDEFECNLVFEGELKFSVDQSRLVLRPGDGIFVNAGALHAAEISKGRAAITHSLVFHPRLTGGSMDSVFWQRLVQPLLKSTAFHYIVLHPEIPWQNEIIAHLQSTWDAVTAKADDYENLARYHLSAALRLLNLNCPAILEKPSLQDAAASERIKNMLRCIEEHYNEDLSVKQIADSAAVSESVCLRTFRRFVGVSPIRYLKQLRLEKAADLLTATDQKISDIAMECGFMDMSYFTRSFREFKGCTPGDYRAER